MDTQGESAQCEGYNILIEVKIYLKIKTTTVALVVVKAMMNTRQILDKPIVHYPLVIYVLWSRFGFTVTESITMIGLVSPDNASLLVSPNCHTSTDACPSGVYKRHRYSSATLVRTTFNSYCLHMWGQTSSAMYIRHVLLSIAALMTVTTTGNKFICTHVGSL